MVLSPFSGRSRSNSRSSLKEKGGGGGRKRSGSRSRSSSCTSLYDDSWVETLDKEDGAAGGLGMGVHGLFERHNVCHSRSKLVTVDVGEHTLEFETQVLNLDRYVAPHLPPSPMKGSPEVSFNGPTVSVEDLEIGNGSQVAAGQGSTAQDGQTSLEKPPAPVPSAQSEVAFAVLIIPQEYSDATLEISSPEVEYNLALSAAGLNASEPNPSDSDRKDAEQLRAWGGSSSESRGQSGSGGDDPGRLSRTSGPNLFTSLFGESSLQLPTKNVATGQGGGLREMGRKEQRPVQGETRKTTQLLRILVLSQKERAFYRVI